MIDYGLEPRLKEIFEYLSNKIKAAKGNLYLLSNESFSKDPFGSKFIKKYFAGDRPGQPGATKVVFLLLKYYVKSILVFVLYCAYMLLHKMVLPLPKHNHQKELIVVDTFFLVDRIAKAKVVQEMYLPELGDVLKKHEIQYAYLPVFCDIKNIRSFIKSLFIIKSSKVPVISEFTMLGLRDITSLAVFMLRYPIEIIKYAWHLPKDGTDGLLKGTLLAEVGSVTFLTHSRYLQGLAVGRTFGSNVKIIGWYENQMIDKNLYKGIRDSGFDIKIIGAQLLLYSPLYLSVHVDQNEADIGLVPDKVVVNGKYYIPTSDSVDFEVGPSLRYKKVFSCKHRCGQKAGKVVVILSYLAENNRFMLEILKDIKFECEVLIKAHPAAPIAQFDHLLKPYYKIVGEDVYELSKNAKMVIACATGAMIEMAALGIPIIAVKGKDSFDYNPMIDLGKGVLWHEVTSENELVAAVKTIESLKDDRILKDIGEQYKELFFCEPTKENIKKAFEL